MRRTRRAIAAAVIAVVAAACARERAVEPQRLDAGRLGTVVVMARPGAAAGLVVLFSDADGWDDDDVQAARALAAEDRVVVGVDLRTYLAGLAASDDGCHYLISEVEELSKRVQHDLGFAAYRTPVLAGVGAGGTLAYAALAQAPTATVAGAVAVDPAEALPTRVALCPGAPASPDPSGGFRYGPSAALPGWYATAPPGDDVAVRLVAALDVHAPVVPGAARARVEDLPLIEYPAERASPLLAVIYSGDGGWRDLDKQIGEALAREGVAVVGVDSLRYFWQRRPPETIAHDLAAILHTYGARWGATATVLVGYSFGADVLPFAYNRLPDDVRRDVRQLSLLALGDATTFQFSVQGWFGDDDEGTPVLPELQRIDLRLVQCFYGEDEKESLCRDPALRRAEIIETSGGHHFDGDYDALAARILDGARRRGAGATS